MAIGKCWLGEINQLMLASESASFSNFSLIVSLLDCSWDSRMISKSVLWGSFIYTSQDNPLFFGRVRIHEIPLNHSLPWATLCVPLKILSDLWSKTTLWWSWAAYFYSPLLLPHLLKYAVIFFWLVFQSCRRHPRLMDKDQSRLSKPNSTTPTVETVVV